MCRSEVSVRAMATNLSGYVAIITGAGSGTHILLCISTIIAQC